MRFLPVLAAGSLLDIGQGMRVLVVRDTPAILVMDSVSGLVGIEMPQMIEAH